MKIILAVSVIIAVVGGGVIFLNKMSPSNKQQVACTLEAKMCPDGTAVGRVGPSCEFTPCPPANLPFQEFTATFSIITNGTVRVFTDKKYHNQGSDAFITSSDPNTIYVRTPDITWGDFFSTLPMELSPDCLTTGTGQRFCTNVDKKLAFYLNDVENSNVLSQVIKPKDMLRVEYK